ncbi:MBL fold metallo-hydrolase [Aurantiacibacter gilvus]|uniref:MBL fold metallo-hydrolase n=1 Tax=Aurantiacibacter gilvus TaxID=3139141 RepID=A0ABU9IAB3_9SPHN
MALPPQPWPTGEVEQLEPLVARVLAANASPYTFTGTQTYLVGTEDLAVIDPGPADEDHLAALNAAIAGRPVRAIMCTHTHRDHSPAAAPLAEATGAPVVGCAPLVIESSPDDSWPRVDAPFDSAYDPLRVLEDGEAMTGTGWTLRAVATPGHTSNHLCYALEESGAMFTGDHVMGWSTSVVVPPDGDMADYMASLARLYEREQDRIYYPAHGPAVTKPRQLVRGMIGHRRARERQVLKLLVDSPSEVSALIPVMYKGVDERLWPAATQSVLAHLLDLEKRGMVSRSGQAWQVSGAIDS